MIPPKFDYAPRCGCCGSYMLKREGVYYRFSDWFQCLNTGDCEQAGMWVVV